MDVVVVVIIVLLVCVSRIDLDGISLHAMIALFVYQ